jgi:hypothetical protein
MTTGIDPHIPLLKGQDDFADWRDYISIYLRSLDLINHIEPKAETEVDRDSADYKKDEAKVNLILICRVGPAIKGRIRNVGWKSDATGRATFKAIERAAFPSPFMTFRELTQIKRSQYISMDAFLNRLTTFFDATKDLFGQNDALWVTTALHGIRDTHPDCSTGGLMISRKMLTASLDKPFVRS